MRTWFLSVLLIVVACEQSPRQGDAGGHDMCARCETWAPPSGCHLDHYPTSPCDCPIVICDDAGVRPPADAGIDGSFGCMLPPPGCRGIDPITCAYACDDAGPADAGDPDAR